MLVELGAFHLKVNEPYTLSSNWLIPMYCDNRVMLSDPAAFDFAANQLQSLIYTHAPHAQMISAVATAGIPWGSPVARAMKLPFSYVRSKPKDYGLNQLIEGRIVPGQEVVVVEDLITRGDSSLHAVRELRKAGAVVKGVVALFTYDLPVAREAFIKEGVWLQTVTDYHALIAAAEAAGKILPADKLILTEWRKDPANWKPAVGA